MSNPLHWAAEHPVPVAVGVFAVGAVLLLLMGGKGGQASDGGMSAFYAAQAAQTNAAAGLAATQSNNATALGIADLQGKYGLASASVNNQAAVTINQSNNDLSAYQTYKQVRLGTQEATFAYQTGVNGGNVQDFTSALGAINHGFSFGTATVH